MEPAARTSATSAHPIFDDASTIADALPRPLHIPTGSYGLSFAAAALGRFAPFRQVKSSLSCMKTGCYVFGGIVLTLSSGFLAPALGGVLLLSALRRVIQQRAPQWLQLGKKLQERIALALKHPQNAVEGHEIPANEAQSRFHKLSEIAGKITDSRVFCTAKRVAAYLKPAAFITAGILLTFSPVPFTSIPATCLIITGLWYLSVQCAKEKMQKRLGEGAQHAEENLHVGHGLLNQGHEELLQVKSGLPAVIEQHAVVEHAILEAIPQGAEKHLESNSGDGLVRHTVNAARAIEEAAIIRDTVAREIHASLGSLDGHMSAVENQISRLEGLRNRAGRLDVQDANAVTRTYQTSLEILAREGDRINLDRIQADWGSYQDKIREAQRFIREAQRTLEERRRRLGDGGEAQEVVSMPIGGSSGPSKEEAYSSSEEVVPPLATVAAGGPQVQVQQRQDATIALEQQRLATAQQELTTLQEQASSIQQHIDLAIQRVEMGNHEIAQAPETFKAHTRPTLWFWSVTKKLGSFIVSMPKAMFDARYGNDLKEMFEGEKPRKHAHRA